jgi:hypothetical protein
MKCLKKTTIKKGKRWYDMNNNFSAFLKEVYKENTIVKDIDSNKIGRLVNITDKGLFKLNVADNDYYINPLEHEFETLENNSKNNLCYEVMSYIRKNNKEEYLIKYKDDVDAFSKIENYISTNDGILNIIDVVFDNIKLVIKNKNLNDKETSEVLDNSISILSKINEYSKENENYLEYDIL